MIERPADLACFRCGELEPATFTHREHLRMAFEMLRRDEFPETALYDSRALQSLTARAGVPGKFHPTIPVAFLSRLAERMSGRGAETFEAFALAHPDLLDGSVLERLYRPERLASAAARTTFLLPTTLAGEIGAAALSGWARCVAWRHGGTARRRCGARSGRAQRPLRRPRAHSAPRRAAPSARKVSARLP